MILFFSIQFLVLFKKKMDIIRKPPNITFDYSTFQFLVLYAELCEEVYKTVQILRH